MSRRLALLVLLGGAAPSACDLSRDPAGTLERVRATRLLRVGASPAPPGLLRTDGGEASGTEAELVRRLADQLGAEVEWRWGPCEDHLQALAKHRLDLVAAGLTEESPWHDTVGLSQPWRDAEGQARVLAVPPGENGWLRLVDEVIRGGGP